MPTARRTTHVELLPCTIGGTDWGATVEDDHFLREVDQSPLPQKAKKGTTGAPDEDGAEEPPEESRVVTEFAKITRKTPPRQSCYTRLKAWFAGRYENLISKDLMAEMYAKKCHELYTDGRTLCWLVCGTDCKTLCLTTCEQACHKLCREVCRNVCTGQCRRCTGDCGQWEGCQGNCTKTCKGACVGVYEKISTEAPNEFLPAAPPLGYRLRNTKPDMSQIVYDEAEAEVRDPDPLIAAISLRMKWAEIQRLQRRSKELRARKIRDTYQLWDEAEDDGEEVMVPTSRESPSNLSHELGETRDLLEFAIRKYWKLRRYLSRESTVLVRFRLLISAIVQFASSITLFCLVASELEGGNFALVTTGFMAACVGVSVSLLCIFGSLPDIPNEALLFFCHCGEIWMSFIVVSFLLVDIEHMVTMQQECDPSLQNYGGDDPCSRLVRGYFTLAVAVVLAICVVCARTFPFSHATLRPFPTHRTSARTPRRRSWTRRTTVAPGRTASCSSSTDMLWSGVCARQLPRGTTPSTFFIYPHPHTPTNHTQSCKCRF